MEGRKPKKINTTKSKAKRPSKVPATQGKSSTVTKRQAVLSVQKKPSTKKPAAQPAVRKPIARGTKKVQKKTVVRTTRKSVPVVDSITQLPPSRVSGLTQPLTVQAIANPMLKRSADVHPWSLRHHFVVIISLTLVGVIAMVLIASYTQSTIQDIESLNTPSSTLMKPTATETRFFTTAAGEIKLALPTSWSVTENTDEQITYTHATLPDTTITIDVTENDYTDVATWYTALKPDYTNSAVIASSAEVSALRGLTVTATSADDKPLKIVYLPIQKNLRERYVVTIQAQSPADSVTAVDEALTEIVSNFSVN